MKIKKVGSKSTYLIIIGVIIIIGLVFYFDKKNNTENTMPIATILMSLAATVTFLYTIEKNKESKEQFEQERNEVKAQFEEQQKFFQKQQFESTFFNMINKLNDIVENLTITYDQRISSTPIQINGNSRSQEHQIRKVTINGRNIFKFLYESNKIRFTPPDIIAEIVFSLKENRQSFKRNKGKCTI